MEIAMDERKPDAKPKSRYMYVGMLARINAHVHMSTRVDGVRWFFRNIDEILKSTSDMIPAKRKPLLTAL